MARRTDFAVFKSKSRSASRESVVGGAAPVDEPSRRWQHHPPRRHRRLADSQNGNKTTPARFARGKPERVAVQLTRRGIDCSAFVLSVFGAATGMTLPRVAASQAQEGEKVEKSNLQKGDLVFFSQGRGRISHVGIVENVTEEGDVKFIHAATSRGVMISSLNDSYWGPKYRFAKRIISPETFNSNLANN